MYDAIKVENKFFADSIPAKSRGTARSVSELYDSKLVDSLVQDTKVHDANFATLKTELSKLHNSLYEPKWNVYYAKDIDIDYGGGFVDYVEFFTVDWAGIMNENRNLFGNNANYIPRVNAALTQKKVNVYTYEVAYDLRFVEMEKMKKLTLQKSIQDIYKDAIVAGWDLFVQQVAYLGIQGATGFFNDANVSITTIDNSTASAANKGFKGMPDEAVVSFFNGVFETYLEDTNLNMSLIPDTFLVPTFVGSDLTGRMSDLYTNTLRKFIIDHNLGSDESSGEVKIKIESRPQLNDLGGHGRIVAYKKDKAFVRMDVPYPIQHFITLPNIERMSYTSAFVGQVSQVQLPYNTSNAELGVVTYWDFTK